MQTVAQTRPILRRVLTIAAVAIAGFLAWDRLVKPQVIPKRFGVVEAGHIFRSGKLTPATMESVVRANGIKTIVDLGAWVNDPRGERLEAQTARVLGVERHVFDLSGDSTGDPNNYVEALRLMTDPANQPVLVHCGAGTERTGALVFLYRTIVEGKPEAEALAEARRAGHDPRRNPRLNQTLEHWKDPIARAYREGGPVITEQRADRPTDLAADHPVGPSVPASEAVVPAPAQQPAASGATPPEAQPGADPS